MCFEATEKSLLSPTPQTRSSIQDPLDLTPELYEKPILRSCYIHVERCDKIWETMKLIRELQEPPSDSPESCDYEDYEDDDYEETTDSPLNDEESNSSSQANPHLPYIKYQPVLGNGNTSLPNFQFSVKSTRALYQCNTCGRQYSHRSTLREHSERVHNIILPMIRRPPKFKAESADLIKMEDKSPEPEDEESTHESASTISSSPSEDKERLLESQMEQQDGEYVTASGKVRHYGTCKHCDRVLSDKYYLKVHETLIHGVVSTFAFGAGPLVLRNYVAKAKEVHNCKLCDYSFYGSLKLAQHEEIIHGIAQPKVSIQIKSPNVLEKLKSPEANKINGRKQVATKQPATSCLQTSFSPQKPEIIDETAEPKGSKSKGRRKKQKVKKQKTLRTCEACGKLYANDTNWKIHLITVHGIVPPMRSVPQRAPSRSYPSNSLSVHICKYCNKRFGYATTLRNHIILQHMKEQISSQKGLKPMIQTKLGQTKTVAPSKSSMGPMKTLAPTKAPMGSIKTPMGSIKTSMGSIKTSMGSIKTSMGSVKNPMSSTKNIVPTKLTHLKPPPKLNKNALPEPDESNPLVWTCSVCSSTYCSRQSLLYHMANVHAIYQTHQRKFRINDMNKPHKCRGCHERFWNKKNLAVHELIFHGIRGMGATPTKLMNQASKRTPVAKPKIVKIEKPQPTKVKVSREKVLFEDDDIYKTPRTPNVKIKQEPSTSQVQPDLADDPIIQCILCNRHCKKIKKHFIEFHKVRNPDILISQCKISPMNPITRQVPKKEPIKQESLTLTIKKDPDEILMAVRKRRPLDSMSSKRTMIIPPPDAPFELRLKKVGGRRRRIYCCKLCKYGTLSHETIKKHNKVDHPEGSSVPLEERSEFEDGQIDVKMPQIQRRRSEGQLLTRKRRRESLDEREIQKRRISSAFGGELRMTRAVKRLREELEHKCDNCERIFRNGDILAAHKVSCKSRTFELGMESNDTRESSDRDSGIGISITIKKKNDSYEIVSRDSSGERPSKRSNVDGYSDSSDTRQSCFSPDHRVIKLEKMEDDDVEVDLEGDVFTETVDAVEDPPAGQVLSLRDLCRRVLGHKREVKKPIKKEIKVPEQHQCRVCLGFYPSVRSRNTHCWMAHKVSANRVRQPGTLRTICVAVLEALGDKEAKKKVWFPCHMCNTVWPSVKSRTGHMNFHDGRRSSSGGNLLLCK